MGGSTQVKTQFKEISGGTMPVQIADTPANHKDSMDILRKNGMRPMSYQEAFMQLKQNETLRNELKGKQFYIEGTGIDKSGLYTIDKNGELKRGKGDVEETVNVWDGNSSLSVYVRDDDGAQRGRRRYFLNGLQLLDVVAPVVVGVRQGSQAGKVQAGSAGLQAAAEKAIREERPELWSLADDLEKLSPAKIKELERHAAMRKRTEAHVHMRPIFAIPILMTDWARAISHEMVHHWPGDAVNKIREAMRSKPEQKSAKERVLGVTTYYIAGAVGGSTFETVHYAASGKPLPALFYAIATGINGIGMFSFRTLRNKEAKKRRIARIKELESNSTQN